MDLQEEYYVRRKVPAHLVKYVSRASLIMKAKEEAKLDWNWLHISIDMKQEPNHPAYYQFVVAANPVIYASADFSHFSYHHTKVLSDARWEWDQYEVNVRQWADEIARTYVAVPSHEAVFVSWEMFLANYDAWLANFLPYRVIDHLAGSLESTDTDSRIRCIGYVENWIREKYERVYACWRNIRQQLDHNTYADWLAAMVNAPQPAIR